MRSLKWSMAVAMTSSALVLAGCGGSDSDQEAITRTGLGVAAGPYLIGDGVIPDVKTPAIHEFTDLHGNSSELGPENANDTKLLPINTALVPMLATTNPNANTDLNHIWLDTRTGQDGFAWLYFGWERDADKGAAVIMIEFQHGQAPTACKFDGTYTDAQLIAGCNPWSNRAPGDFIIIWDNQGGKVVISKRTFTGSPLTLGANQNLDAAYYAAAYLSTIDETKGEAAIRLLGGLFPAEPTSCESIGNIIPGTVTGNSDTADYKDTVFQPFTDYVTVSLCGDLKVIKATVPTTEVSATAFPFTVSRTGAGNDIFYSNEVPSGQTQAQYTDSTSLKQNADNVIIQDLIPGTDYKLLEGTLPSGWDFVSYSCVVPGVQTPVTGTTQASGVTPFAVVTSQMTVCTITNLRQLGAVKVCKGISPSKSTLLNGATFELYSGATATGTPIATEISGTDGTDGTGCSCFDGLAWGTYTVKESAPPTYYAPPSSTTQQVSVNANYTCATLPAASWLSFYNDPYSLLEAKYSFKFTDLTTHTDATITCSSIDGTLLAQTSLTSGTASVFTSTAHTGNLVPGTYNFSLSCSVNITDP